MEKKTQKVSWRTWWNETASSSMLDSVKLYNGHATKEKKLKK